MFDGVVASRDAAEPLLCSLGGESPLNTRFGIHVEATLQRWAVGPAASDTRHGCFVLRGRESVVETGEALTLVSYSQACSSPVVGPSAPFSWSRSPSAGRLVLGGSGGGHASPSPATTSAVVAVTVLAIQAFVRALGGEPVAERFGINAEDLVAAHGISHISILSVRGYPEEQAREKSVSNCAGS